MNTNRTLVIAVIAATTLCAALVWSNIAAVGRARDWKTQLDAKEAELQDLSASKRGTMARADTGLGELLAQRDTEYAQLREDYDKLKQQLTNSTARRASVAVPGNERGQRGANNAWIERLRLQDPERYNRMIAARDERRQRVEQQYQDQMAQLDHRIQTAPTQEEVDLASQIAETLDRLTQLRQAREALASLPEAQRLAQAQELAAQTREAFRTLGQLRDQDRTLQYEQLADQLGLKDSDKQILVQSIPQILENTQYSPQRNQGGPGGLGGGDGRTGGSATQPSTTSSSPTQ